MTLNFTTPSGTGKATARAGSRSSQWQTQPRLCPRVGSTVAAPCAISPPSVALIMSCLAWSCFSILAGWWSEHYTHSFLCTTNLRTAGMWPPPPKNMQDCHWVKLSREGEEWCWGGYGSSGSGVHRILSLQSAASQQLFSDLQQRFC